VSVRSSTALEKGGAVRVASLQSQIRATPYMEGLSKAEQEAAMTYRRIALYATARSKVF